MNASCCVPEAVKKPQTTHFHHHHVGWFEVQVWSVPNMSAVTMVRTICFISPQHCYCKRPGLYLFGLCFDVLFGQERLFPGMTPRHTRTFDHQQVRIKHSWRSFKKTLGFLEMFYSALNSQFMGWLFWSSYFLHHFKMIFLTSQGENLFQIISKSLSSFIVNCFLKV